MFKILIVSRFRSYYEKFPSVLWSVTIVNKTDEIAENEETVEDDVGEV